ncbi:MAG: hypothetical protein AAF219_01610 [Myxococcota bacterium]
MLNGRSFKKHVRRLDEAGRRLYQEHGRNIDGRRAFVEQIIDDAMIRLAFGEEAELYEST